MSETVGTAKIRLEFDGSSVDKSADAVGKKVGDKLSGAAKTIGKGFAVAVSSAATSLGGLTVAATKLYSDYEQLTGGVETLFKDAYGEVMANANQAFETAGMSANEYMETVTSFSASLLQGLGGDTAAAAKIADTAIVDMSDNANKMGTDMSLIQNAYQGFAKQNYTMLDNLKLGYGGTASEMARLINDSGVLGDSMEVTAETVNDVSFDKVIEAIHKVQENMGITGTTAKEASTTIQGSFGSMKAAWKNLLTGMADESQQIGPLIDNLVQTAGDFVGNLLPVMETALGSLSNLISGLVPKILEALPGLISTIVPALVNAAVSIVNSISAQLPAIITTLVDALVACTPALLDGAIQLLMAIVQALPVIIEALVSALPTLLDSIVTTLTSPEFLQMVLEAGLNLLMEVVNAIPQMLTSLIAALPSILDNIVAFLTNPGTIQMLLGAAVQLFFALVQAVPQILGQLVQAFRDLVVKLWNSIVANFSEFAGNFGSQITSIFKNAVNGVLQFIENFINGPINVINGFVDAINSALSALGVNIGHIPNVHLPRLAQGGVAVGATAAMIGEEGQEAVLPLEQNTGNWSGLLADTLLDAMDERGGAGGRSIVININNAKNLDENELSDLMLRKLREIA